jgi:hypothetical protein
MSKFENIEKFTAIEIEDKLHVRGEIVNLDWKSSSYKLVLNLGKYPVSMRDIVRAKDKYTGLIQKKDITFINNELNSSKIETKLIEEIFGAFLIETIKNTSHVYYLKELFYLKRHQFKSYDEYSYDRGELKFNDQYLQYQSKNNASLKYVMHFDKYVKSDPNNPASSIKEAEINRKYEVIFDDATKEPSKCMFLASARYYSTEYDRSTGEKLSLKTGLWLEKLDNFETFKVMMDIHLTAKFFIDRFKAAYQKEIGSLLEIETASVKLGKLDRDLFYASFVHADLTLSELQLPSSSTQEILDSLAHFTYQSTNGNLVLFDLRPLKFSKDYILITEPVIFSTTSNRYSSSDLGGKGLKIFKQEHKCNSVCKKLNLFKLI